MSTFIKSMIAAVALSVCSVAVAGGHRHGYGGHGHYQHRHFNNHHWHHNHGWVAPLIIGGAVTYALTRPNPIIVDQPVIVQQVPQPVQVQCTEWREVLQADGQIVKERTCVQR